MSTSEIISYLSAIGFGGLLGVIIKSFLDYGIHRQRMLFEARTKAYAGITGRIFNLFMEPDITVLKDDALIWAKINAVISEAMLLGSPKLTDYLGEFKVKVHEFHKQLDAKQDSAETHKQLVQLAGKVYDQMRKDLFITSKSAWAKSKTKDS